MTSEPNEEQVTVRDDGTVEVELPSEPSAARRARHFVQEHWSHLSVDVLDDVALIVTELVGNAVRHGSPEICLRLRSQPFAVDVAVLDHGPGHPRRKTAEEVEGQDSGRGLAIVDRLSAAWGVDTIDGGKVVWASIDHD